MDRRVRKSQEAIETALVQLLAKKNFETITVREVTEQANVNRSTFYLHYQDKYDLLNKIVEAHITQLETLCQSVSDLTFEEANYVWFDYFDRHRLFFSTMLATQSADYFRSRFLQLVREELQDEVDVIGGTNDGLDQALVIQFLASALVGVVEWWMKSETRLPAPAIARQTGLLMDRNVGSP
jgi:AcrR family transcriptional regulator